MEKNNETKSKITNTLKLLTKWEIQLVIIILILVIIGSNISPFFLDVKNQVRNSKNLIEIALMALPMTFIIITGNIDLSVANLLLMSAVVMAKLFENGIPMGWAFAGALLAGTLGGLLNGILVGIVRLPALVATLGTYTLFRGLGFSLLKDFTVKGFPDWFNFLGQGKFLDTDIPIQVVIFIFFAILFGLLLHRTTLGRYIYVIGQNEDACRYSGVPVDGVKILIFTLSGFMSALAGMILAARYASVDADIATGYELTVITAVVLGGVLTTGGTGTMPGVVLSLILLSEVRLLMNLLNTKGPIQQIAFGFLLIMAILVPRQIDRIRSKRRLKSLERKITETESTI